MRGLLVLLLAGAMVAPVGAHAQDFSGPLSPGAFEATLNMGPVANTLRQQMQGAPQPSRGAKAPPAAAPKAAANLRFVPSKERRKTNLAHFVSRTRAVDPAAADRMAALFASTDMIEQMRAPLAGAGLRIDDVADAYTIWWITAWTATRGNNDTPDTATTAAVRAQAARALSATPAIASAKDAARQELAEALLIQAALLDSAVEQSKGKPAQLKAVGAAAAQGARGMGLDLSTMTLGRQGFVPAR